MRVKHTRRTAIVVLCLLKLDGFVRAGNVNTLRLQRLLWAKTQLRRLEDLPRAAREQLALVAVLLGLRLLALAEFIVQEKQNAITHKGGEPVYRRIIETVETTAGTSPDLPMGEPTPVLVFGHDEHGKGEIIDLTPDLEHEEQTTPKYPVLTAPSANRITTIDRQRKPVDWPVVLQTAKFRLAAGQSLRAVARDLGVPESTLRSRIKKLRVPMQEVTA